MGPSAAVSHVRTRGLLRQLAQQARQRSFPPDPAPAHAVVRAERRLGLVFRRRGRARARATPAGAALSTRLGSEDYPPPKTSLTLSKKLLFSAGTVSSVPNVVLSWRN